MNTLHQFLAFANTQFNSTQSINKQLPATEPFQLLLLRSGMHRQFGVIRWVILANSQKKNENSQNSFSSNQSAGITLVDFDHLSHFNKTLTDWLI